MTPDEKRMEQRSMRIEEAIRRIETGVDGILQMQTSQEVSISAQQLTSRSLLRLHADLMEAQVEQEHAYERLERMQERTQEQFQPLMERLDRFISGQGGNGRQS